MQSTFDIRFSNVRSRDQTVKQTRTRKTFNKQHEFAQLKTQNQLNSKHDQIRFKLVIFQIRFSLIQKVDIFIQKQFVVRHYLFQYIVDEKYVKHICSIDYEHEKISDSTLRFIYNVFKIDNIFVFDRHVNITCEKQIDQ